MCQTELDFRSSEGLAEQLDMIGLLLHAKIRIGGGDGSFNWHLAEAIRGTGKLSKRIIGDPELYRLYGSGYTVGSLTEEGKQDLFL